jgi:hypothetical protein
MSLICPAHRGRTSSPSKTALRHGSFSRAAATSGRRAVQSSPPREINRPYRGRSKPSTDSLELDLMEPAQTGWCVADEGSRAPATRRLEEACRRRCCAPRARRGASSLFSRRDLVEVAPGFDAAPLILESASPFRLPALRVICFDQEPGRLRARPRVVPRLLIRVSLTCRGASCRRAGTPGDLSQARARIAFGEPSGPRSTPSRCRLRTGRQGSCPRKLPYSSGWSSTCTASRRTRGIERRDPLGTAQLFSVPSSYEPKVVVKPSGRVLLDDETQGPPRGFVSSAPAGSRVRSNFRFARYDAAATAFRRRVGDSLSRPA